MYLKIIIVLTFIILSTKTQENSTKSANASNDRIHIQKCREYQSAVYDYISVLSFVAGGGRQKIRVNKCGHDKIPLIVGGESAQPREFPHMALIGFEIGNNKIKYACGGTLISDLFVLTAGHCLYSRELGEPEFVRLGELDVQEVTDDAKPIDFTIKEIIPHPEFQLSSRYNDIGLLKLNEKIQLNPYIRPACLPTEFDSLDNNYIATGWGNTEWMGAMSSNLQKVILQKFNHTKCNNIYLNQLISRLNDGIKNSTQLCAGSKNESKDTCQGDSGGPLQVVHHSEYCMYSVVGITSFGLSCGASGVPGVYTRIYPYVDWIEKIVWKS